jgi:hypothetical protein
MYEIDIKQSSQYKKLLNEKNINNIPTRIDNLIRYIDELNLCPSVTDLNTLKNRYINELINIKNKFVNHNKLRKSKKTFKKRKITAEKKVTIGGKEFHIVEYEYED